MLLWPARRAIRLLYGYEARAASGKAQPQARRASVEGAVIFLSKKEEEQDVEFSRGNGALPDVGTAVVGSNSSGRHGIALMQ